jgi:hypothetical protein
MPESDLNALLKGMKPSLSETEYYYGTFDEGTLMELSGYLDYIIGIFKEEEGLTVIFSGEAKDEISQLTDKKIEGPFALITLAINSDLMAVGFLAKITEALAKEKISVNAVSAYHHDHLLVPFGRKGDAIKALERLAGGKEHL